MQIQFKHLFSAAALTVTTGFTGLTAFVAVTAAAPMAHAARGELKPLPEGIETQFVVHTTNDRDRDISHMALMIGEGGKVQGLYTERERRGKIAENNIYSLRELQSRSGVVVEESDGRDVILLQGKVDDESGSGRLRIRYLTNGLFKKYGECVLAAQRDENDTWRVSNPATGRAVENIHIVTYKLGIRRLEGACD